MSEIYKVLYHRLNGRVSVNQFERVLGKTMYKALISYERYAKVQNDDLAELMLKSLGDEALFSKKLQELLITNVLLDDEILIVALLLNIPTHKPRLIREQILKKSGYLVARALQKFFGLSITERRIDKVTTDELICEPGRTLHEYQKVIKNSIVKILLEDPKAKMVVHMPTGSGKTNTCVEAIVDFVRTRPFGEGLVIWFAHSNELCQQAYETMVSVWKMRGDSSMPIIRVFGENDPINEIYSFKTGVVFIGFPKFVALSNKKDTDSIKFRSYLSTNAQLVVIDEAHKSLARTYEKAISYVSSMPNCRLVGLTATPGRANNVYDNSNDTLAEMFGGKLITITDENLSDVEDQIGYLQNLGYLAKIDHRTIDIDIDSFTDEELRKIELQGELDNNHIDKIVESPLRNKAIVDEITKCLDDPRKDHVLVFAASVSHCYVLKALLMMDGIRSEVVTGDLEMYSRNKIIDEFKNGDIRVLINFGVLSTGFDAPKLKSLIIARHTSSMILYSQMIGRALRGVKNGGNSMNYVIDLIDNVSQLGNPSFLFRYWEDFWGKKYKNN